MKFRQIIFQILLKLSFFKPTAVQRNKEIEWIDNYNLRHKLKTVKNQLAVHLRTAHSKSTWQ